MARASAIAAVMNINYIVNVSIMRIQETVCVAGGLLDALVIVYNYMHVLYINKLRITCSGAQR